MVSKFDTLESDLSFNADEFFRVSVAERVRLCRLLAKRAEEVAALADPRQAEGYREIARNWLRLATDMENAASDRSRG